MSRRPPTPTRSSHLFPLTTLFHSVAVQVELDLALAPPAVGVDSPGQVGADVVPVALHSVDDRVGLEILERVAALPLRVEVRLVRVVATDLVGRSEEHTSELQSLMRISYAIFCLQKKIKHHYI